MAESNDSWFSTAKFKSASVFDAVRKDLGEIFSVVKDEASAATTAFSQTLKLDEPDSTASQLKKSFSTFLGQVNTVLNPAPEDDDTEAILITSGHDSVPLTELQKHLLELQSKDATYLTPPEPALKTQYNRWEEVILEDQLTQDRLARHLASSTVLNDKYVSLVPDKVGHHDFWMRYLFRKALLEDGLAQAEAAERKAKLTETANIPDTPQVVPVVEPTMVQPKAVLSPIMQSKSSNDILNKSSPLSLHEELSQSQSIQSSESTPSFSSLGFTTDLTEDVVRWELEDFSCDVELTEEQQSQLLHEYEKEMQERTTTTTKDNKIDTSKPDSTTPTKKSANDGKSGKNTSTTSTKATSKKSPPTAKISKDSLKSKASSTSSNAKSNKNQTTKGSNKDQNKKQADSKTDMTLPVNADHFKEDNQNKEIKSKGSKDSVDSSKSSSDNRSNNSDESWEKEFEDLED